MTKRNCVSKVRGWCGLDKVLMALPGGRSAAARRQAHPPEGLTWPCCARCKPSVLHSNRSSLLRCGYIRRPARVHHVTDQYNASIMTAVLHLARRPSTTQNFAEATAMKACHRLVRILTLQVEICSEEFVLVPLCSAATSKLCEVSKQSEALAMLAPGGIPPGFR